MNTIPELRPAEIVEVERGIFALNGAVYPTGSIKDVMVHQIISEAMDNGEIGSGTHMFEATSGNTGIALAYIGMEIRRRVTIVIPADMSEERMAKLKGFGAEISLVGPSDFKGAVAKRDELVGLHGKNAFSTRQFSNPRNTKGHEEITGNAIVKFAAEKLGGQPIAAFVAGTGTGGTLMGAGRQIRREHPESKIIAVEPAESTAMSNPANIGPHAVQGTGDGFIPEIVNMEEVHGIQVISSLDAIKRTIQLQLSGLYVGISSGSNVLAAERYRDEVNPKGVVFTVLPDSGDRYESLLAVHR